MKHDKNTSNRNGNRPCLSNTLIDASKLGWELTLHTMSLTELQGNSNNLLDITLFD